MHKTDPPASAIMGRMLENNSAFGAGHLACGHGDDSGGHGSMTLAANDTRTDS